LSRTGVKRVLVLDQDPDFLNQLSQGFSNEPYELLLATTVDQGLRLLGEAHPDLLVVDSSLQPALQATLRANSRTGLPPILVTLQGHDPEEEAVLEAFERGADDLACKPVSVAWLKTRFRIWLSRSGRFRKPS
jgi:DNA-binding response OmpR family regulator